MLVIQRPSVEAIGDDHPTRQRFAVGPLEPGFGHTIGNSLRRTLLSSIPGAAITTVKFDGVEHEFTTIKGMTEDITELIMNLKDVVVVSQSDEPVVLRVDAKGPSSFKAGDIQTTADIEILNPSLHLATLNAGAQLGFDITIERGRGYMSTDRDAESRVIGVIHRRNFLASASRHVRCRANSRCAKHQLRPPHSRHRDRWFNFST
jgi:DNA-directed RNA polymerase subunit alpha